MSKPNQRILKQLEEQKMFDVINLIEEEAENKLIVEAFENHVLRANNRYDKWMKTLQSLQKSNENSRELTLFMEILKERSMRQPEYRRIYKYLKQLN